MTKRATHPLTSRYPLTRRSPQPRRSRTSVSPMHRIRHPPGRSADRDGPAGRRCLRSPAATRRDPPRGSRRGRRDRRDPGPRVGRSPRTVRARAAGLDRRRLRARGAVGPRLCPGVPSRVLQADAVVHPLPDRGGRRRSRRPVPARRRRRPRPRRVGAATDWDAAAEIAHKTVAFFLLTSALPVGLVVLLGTGVASGVLPGGGSIALSAVPAAVSLAAILRPLRSASSLAGPQSSSGRPQGSRLGRAAPALAATADGVEEALKHLRRTIRCS